MSRRFAVLLALAAAIPLGAQMRSTRTIFDTKPVQQRMRQATTSTDTVSMSTAAMTADDMEEVETCTNADGTMVAIPIGFNPIKRDNARAECFWQQDGSELLTTAELINSGGSTAAATEVLSDFLNGIRIAFSTAVASQGEDDTETTDDEKTANVNLLRANGGNVALSASYPLYIKPYTSGEIVAITYARLGGVFDSFGDTGTATSSLDFNELNANAEWALTTESNVKTINGTFNFELYTNAGIIAGTKLFREAVGAKSSAFLHGEVGVNLKISNKGNIGVAWNWFSADGVPDSATVVVGFGR